MNQIIPTQFIRIKVKTGWLYTPASQVKYIHCTDTEGTVIELLNGTRFESTESAKDIGLTLGAAKVF